MRFLLLLLLSAFGLSAQTISYFNQGFLRQPSAQADMQYLGVLNLVQVTSNALWSGSVPSPAYVQKAGDTMTGTLFAKSTSIQATNSSVIASNIYVYGQMLVADSIEFQAPTPLYFIWDSPAASNEVKLVGGQMITEDLTIGGVATGNGAGLTNIPFGSLPSGILTNNWNGPPINVTNSLIVTGIVHKIESGGVNTLVVTNGSVRIAKATTTLGYPLEVNGSLYASGSIVTDFQYLGPGSKFALKAAGTGSCLDIMGGGGQSEMTISIGQRSGSTLKVSNIVMVTRSPGYTVPVGSPPQIVFLNYTNGPEDVIVSGTVTATNGLIANFTTATNKISLPFAMLSSTNTLTAVAGTTNKVAWSNIELISRMSTAVGASGVTNIEPGKYMVTVSAIADSSTLPNKHMVLWARINNVDVPRSATIVQIPNASTEMTLAVTFLLNLAAGDYFEIVWGNDDNGVQMLASTTLAGAPTIPYCPSIIMTVNKISD